jgi:hypothetical protein
MKAKREAGDAPVEPADVAPDRPSRRSPMPASRTRRRGPAHRNGRTMSADDRIEDSSAPLIEHLAELRTRLIRSVLAFVVAMVACFTVAQPILELHPGAARSTCCVARGESPS